MTKKIYYECDYCGRHEEQSVAVSDLWGATYHQEDLHICAKCREDQEYEFADLEGEV